MISNRRSLIRRLTAAVGAGLVAYRAAEPAPAKAAAPGPQRVVYHLSDLAKVSFVLGNMANHVEGMGGPEAVSLTLVVHGPALEAFTVFKADSTIETRLKALGTANSTFVACGNTLRGQKWTLADLVPGFVVADEGGVVRIAKLQAEGYLYLRP